MKVDQDVGMVAVNLPEGELRISGPEVEGLAQFQSDPTCVQTVRLLGSQTETKKKMSSCEKYRLID